MYSKKNINHVSKERLYKKTNINLKKLKGINPRSEFYLRGFKQISLKKSEVQRNFTKLAKDLHNWEVKDGFRLEKKKKFPAYDLKDNPFRYDSCFMDLLFDQNIPQKLFELTGEVLYLQSVKVRISMPGKSSYLSAHKDTFFVRNKVMGVSPPLINIAYYPHFENKKRTELKLWDGTHLLMFRKRFIETIRRILLKPTSIEKNDNKLLIFDTSVFHKIMPTKEEKGSLRIIYSFCRKHQFLDNESARIFIPEQKEFKKRVSKIKFDF